MNTTGHCVVVGASHAGSQVAVNLRKFGWEGAITLIGDEPLAPYHRPPLSKDFLTGGKTIEQLHLRPAEHYQRADVTLRLGNVVTAIDRTNSRVSVGAGEALAYDALVLATGARVRTLPLVDPTLGGVHYLRNAADIAAIRADLETTRNVVVIGGGYIGLEAAATLRKLGRNVTVIEAAERVLQRVTSAPMSAFFERVHREEGVDVRVATGVKALVGEQRVTAVALDNGEEIAAELVIVGIGVVPNVELASAAGLATDNGIVVDAFGRTSDPAIFACGDCANVSNERLGGPRRLESVQNANDLGLVVAKTLAGQPQPYGAVPWFWSDQFDVKLQIAGLAEGYDTLIARGAADAGRSFALFYLDGARLIAVDAVNRPREFVATRQWLSRDAHVDADKLADESVPLPDCLA